MAVSPWGSFEGNQMPSQFKNIEDLRKWETERGLKSTGHWGPENAAIYAKEQEGAVKDGAMSPAVEGSGGKEEEQGFFGKTWDAAKDAAYTARGALFGDPNAEEMTVPTREEAAAADAAAAEAGRKAETEEAVEAALNDEEGLEGPPTQETTKAVDKALKEKGDKWTGDDYANIIGSLSSLAGAKPELLRSKGSQLASSGGGSLGTNQNIRSLLGHK